MISKSGVMSLVSTLNQRQVLEQQHNQSIVGEAVVIVLHWSGVRVVCCWLCDGNDRNYQWLHVVCVGQLQCSGPEADTMIHDSLHDTMIHYTVILSYSE